LDFSRTGASGYGDGSPLSTLEGHRKAVSLLRKGRRRIVGSLLVGRFTRWTPDRDPVTSRARALRRRPRTARRLPQCTKHTCSLCCELTSQTMARCPRCSLRPARSRLSRTNVHKWKVPQPLLAAAGLQWSHGRHPTTRKSRSITRALRAPSKHLPLRSHARTLAMARGTLSPKRCLARTRSARPHLIPHDEL
jgi:hypothetical protein